MQQQAVSNRQRAVAKPRWRSRRLSALFMAVAAVVLLAACGDDDDSQASTDDTTSTEETSADTTAPAEDSTDTSAPAEGGTDTTSAAPADDGEQTPMLELSSFPGETFANAPSFIAQEMGWFEEEGLDYSIEYPGSTVRSIQTVVGGTTGISWTDAFGIMVANSQDFPLTSLFSTLQGSGFGFAVTPDSPITEWTADQVRGSTIGVTDFAGGEVPLLRGALARLDLEEGSDYELLPVGEGGPDMAAAIEEGSVDLMAGSLLDFEVLRGAGVEMRLITPDYVQEFPGHAYATTPELLEEEREAIVGFLRARAKALVFMQTNPEAAAAIGIAYAPASAEGLSPEEVVTFLETVWLDANAQYFEEGNPQFHQIGMQVPENWETYQEFLIEAGVESEEGVILTEPVDIAAIVDNTLIEEVNDFDYAEVEELARNYQP
jgi:NitT/TauT family transport system substrate-binding protein